MANNAPGTGALGLVTSKNGTYALQNLNAQAAVTNKVSHDRDMPPASVAVAQNNPSQQMTKARGICVFTAWIAQGMNDAVSGALLPYIESAYQINYTLASLIFVGNAIGFLAAAPFVQQLERRYGRSKVLPAAAALNAIAYAIIITQPPFAVVVVCFVLNGFAFSIGLALNNAFVSNHSSGNGLMGIMQGGYGLGGTVAPLIGTAMASNDVQWSFFYFITMALCLGNVFLYWWSFKSYQPPEERLLPPASTSARNMKARSPLRQAVGDRTALLGSLFIFAYQGAEVTISGWVVSFLIDYRAGDPGRVGYVTAGFWAGITLGRFTLCPLIHKLGERFTIPSIIIVWALLHVAVWLSRDVIGDAVTVAILGLISGPVAPVVTSVLSRLLDPRIQLIGISLAWSVGSGGAALAPFVTGVLSQKFGTVVFNPICIVMCVVMESAWWGLPNSQWKKQY